MSYLIRDGILNEGDIVYNTDGRKSGVYTGFDDGGLLVLVDREIQIWGVDECSRYPGWRVRTNDVLSIADEMRPKEEKRLLTLPTDSAERKNYPMLSGLLNYFPAALAGAANTSKLGNDKHNPNQPLHHARGKSMDHGDCIIRHLMDTENLKASFKAGEYSVKQSDILLEANQLVWRALAYSQQLHEEFGAPLAPAAKEEV